MDVIVELLSDKEQTGIIMQNIASYVIYIYPGIISIYLYNFFVARTTKDTQAFIIKSFAISYLYNLALQALFSKTYNLTEVSNKNSLVYNLLLIMISFLIPYLCYKLRESKLFAKLCRCLGIATSVTNVPFELLGEEEEEYTCMKIYLKDEPYIYIGYLGEYEYEDGHEKYVILTGYRKYYIDDKFSEKFVVGHKADEYTEKVFVRYNDIKRIEKIGEKRAKDEIYKETINS